MRTWTPWRLAVVFLIASGCDIYAVTPHPWWVRALVVGGSLIFFRLAAEYIVTIYAENRMAEESKRALRLADQERDLKQIRDAVTKLVDDERRGGK